MKILITGGTGFIGSHLAKYTSSQGHQVVICDNNIRGDKDTFINELIDNNGVEFLKLDLTSANDVKKIDKDFDVIFHLAAINGTENFYKIPFSVMEVAILSTMNLLQHFKDTSVKFVFSSSSEVYAGTIKNNPSLIPTKESIACTIDDISNERFSYGGSKLACEILINSFQKQYGLDYQIIRYHNIYGPRMGTKHVIPQFIKRAKDKEAPFKIYGDTQTRAFCYVDDAVRATLDLGLSNQNGLFHIGNDLEEVEIIKVAKFINEWYNNTQEYDICEAPNGSVQRRCPDITKIKQVLHYEPLVDLKQGLERTIRWYDDWYDSHQQTKGFL
tara:strand:- start:39 stop:1025 length:987 start_codon:yes stop_codon:yes gene_type:complete